MSKARAAVVDLFAGILIVAIVLLDVTVLIQSARLIRLFFPLLVTVAFLVGLWRGAKSVLPAIVVVLLTNAPLIIASALLFGGGDAPLFSMPAVALLFVAIGVAFARTHVARAIAIVLLLVADIAASFGGPALVRFATPTHNVTEAAIPFTIQLVDGRTISSSQLRGKVVVLDFWATWCGPCRRELPEIRRAYDAMKGRPDVALFAIHGVTSTGEGGTPATATTYFRRAGLTMPLALDGGGALEKSYAIHGLPALLVLDRQGRVRMRHLGFVGAERIDETIADKVAELERLP